MNGPDEQRRAMEVFWAGATGGQVDPGHDVSRTMDAGRTLVAVDDGGMVGTVSSYQSWIAVPGGARVPHAAVTDVGVLPTHRRRGIASALLARQLDDVAAAGEPIATLRASEGAIYERFGFGVASYANGVEVETARVRWRSGLPGPGAVRLLNLDDAARVLPSLYDACADRPGMIGRHQLWWNGLEVRRSITGGPFHVVVHGPPGAEDGFARYRPADTTAWFMQEDRTVVVDDLVAASPEARAGLLRYLCSLDLVHRVRFRHLPVDHGLGLLVDDADAVSDEARGEETWLRLVDVLAALRCRSYRPGSVLVGVRDGFRPANAGVYRLCDGAVERVGEPPELTLDVADLAALYLGGVPAWALAEAARVRELAPGAVARLDELLRTPRAPFSGTGF